MDKTFVCHDISPNGSESIFLAYFSSYAKHNHKDDKLSQTMFEKLFKVDLAKKCHNVMLSWSAKDDDAEIAK